MAPGHEPGVADGALVHRFLEGEGLAFDAFYRRFFPRLVAFCERRVHDHAAAEDLAQETLLRAMARLEGFDTSRPLWPWLRGIAEHVTADHLAAAARERTRIVADRHDLRDDTTRLEDQAVLATALGRVPRRQRIALGLRYLEDWDIREAAAFLGLDRSAFDQLLFRARRSLRFEYRRMTEGGLGVLLTPARWLRREVARLVGKVRDLGYQQAEQLLSGTAFQLAAGLLAVGVIGAGLGQIDGGRAEAGPVPQATGPVRLGGSDPDPGSLAPGGASAPSAEAPSLDGRERRVSNITEDVATELGNPNQDVRQPEDVQVSSIVFSPNFEQDETIYLAGLRACFNRSCNRVLFRSTDGGNRWQRLAATGLQGETLLLPPAFPGDDRLFAMGRLGLQVSGDGGESFYPAAVGASVQMGSAAISPTFNSGDPSILIGARTLMRYRDDLRAFEPLPWTSNPGPLEPTYSPTYESDSTVFLGGQRLDPESQAHVGILYTCVASVCEETVFPDMRGPPRIRVPMDFTARHLVYAFANSGAWVSTDGTRSFAHVNLPREGVLWDLALGSSGELLAVVGPSTGLHPSRLYISRDAGISWDRSVGRLLSHGVEFAVAGPDRILVALFGQRGLACSQDAGLTWTRRCLLD